MKLITIIRHRRGGEDHPVTTAVGYMQGKKIRTREVILNETDDSYGCDEVAQVSDEVADLLCGGAYPACRIITKTEVNAGDYRIINNWEEDCQWLADKQRARRWELIGRGLVKPTPEETQELRELKETQELIQHAPS